MEMIIVRIIYIVNEVQFPSKDFLRKPFIPTDFFEQAEYPPRPQRPHELFASDTKAGDTEEDKNFVQRNPFQYEFFHRTFCCVWALVYCRREASQVFLWLDTQCPVKTHKKTERRAFGFVRRTLLFLQAGSFEP